MGDRFSQDPSLIQNNKGSLLSQFTYLNRSSYSPLTQYHHKKPTPLTQATKQQKDAPINNANTVLKIQNNIKVYHSQSLQKNVLTFQSLQKQQLPQITNTIKNTNVQLLQNKKIQIQQLHIKQVNSNSMLQNIKAVERQRQMIKQRQKLEKQKQKQLEEANRQKQTAIVNFQPAIQTLVQQKQALKVGVNQQNEEVNQIQIPIFNELNSQQQQIMLQASDNLIMPEQIIIPNAQIIQINAVPEQQKAVIQQIHEESSIRDKIQHVGVHLLKIAEPYRQLKQYIKQSEFYRSAILHKQYVSQQYLEPIKALYSKVPGIVTQAKYQLVNGYIYDHRVVLTNVFSIGIGLLTLRLNRQRPFKSLLLMTRNTLFSYMMGSLIIVPQIYYPFLQPKMDYITGNSVSQKII